MNKKGALRTRSFRNCLSDEQKKRIEYVAKNFSKVVKYLQLCKNKSLRTAAERESIREDLVKAGMPTNEKVLEGLVSKCNELNAESRMTRRYSAKRSSRRSIAASPVDEDDELNEYELALHRALNEKNLNGEQASSYAMAMTDSKVRAVLLEEFAEELREILGEGECAEALADAG